MILYNMMLNHSLVHYLECASTLNLPQILAYCFHTSLLPGMKF